MLTTKLEIREWEPEEAAGLYRVQVRFVDPLSGRTHEYVAEYRQQQWHAPELVALSRAGLLRDAVLNALHRTTPTPEASHE